MHTFGNETQHPLCGPHADRKATQTEQKLPAESGLFLAKSKWPLKRRVAAASADYLRLLSAKLVRVFLFPNKSWQKQTNKSFVRQSNWRSCSYVTSPQTDWPAALAAFVVVVRIHN